MPAKYFNHLMRMAKLVLKTSQKRRGKKKSNSSGQTVWYDPDGYIQPAKYQSHGIDNGNTNKGIVAGEVIFYGHK